ncbi:sigma factor [Actinoplanes sp. NPDC049118]|uniref:RNA polymerase sigma factor n=1 Tax=Actinoplanes sp. NPDC049118 TaxID=3155769 RepID=UPI0033E594CF
MDNPATESGTSDPVGSPSGVQQPEAAPAGSLEDRRARDLEFSLFYQQDMPRLVGFLIVRGAHPHAAADAAQDAMIEAYRQWDSIATPRAWVRSVAQRSWWRHREDLHTEPLDAETSYEHLLSRDAADEIVNQHAFLAALAMLTDAQREVMAWTYDDYQPTEIADLIHKEPATVRSLLRAGRNVLREARPRAEEQ